VIRVVGITAASIVLAGGCYNYQPVAVIPAPQPGTYLQATLTDSGARALASYVGPEARAVRGRSLGSDETGLRLSVTAVETNRGDELAWQGETVTVPFSFIARTETRRLAKGRTALLVGIGVGGLIGIATGFSLIGSADSPGQGGGPPNPH
jgi:hypothetical protein